ncbi:MAG: PAS domain S-box protein [Desulfuromusa sp.]|nr:PAS domain S-box protein [Desulfuromusa sp.]
MLTSEQQSQRLSLALKGAKCGLWDWDLTEDKIYFDPNYFLIAGYEPDEFPHHLDEWRKRVHPDDLAPSEREIQQYLSGEIKTFTIEFRFKTKNGDWMWILGQGEISERDKDGNPVRFVGLHIDITEHKQTENALQYSEAKLNSILRSAPIGIGQVTNRKINFANENFAQMLGYSVQELIGNNSQMVYPSEEEFERVGRYKYEEIKKKGTGSIETFLQKKDGTLIDVFLSSTPVNQGDLSQGVTFSALDITDRKKAEQALQNAAKEWRLIMDEFEDVIYLLDNNRHLLRANSAFYKVTETTPEQAIGRHIVELIHPQGEEDPCPICLAQEEKRDFVMVMEADDEINPAGRPIKISVKIVRDEAGASTGILMNLHDLTQTRLAEQTLRESEQKFRLLADYTYDWEYWLDPEENYVYVSPSCERITGYSADEFMSNPKLLFDLVSPAYVETVHQHYADKNNRETPLYSIEFPIRNKAGEERWLEHHCSPIFDEQGHYLGRRGNNRDITEQHQALHTIIKQKEIAQQYLDIAGVMFGALNRQGDITLMNKKGYQILGYPEGELLGRNWFEVCLPAAIQTEVKGILRQHMIGDCKPLEFYENAILNSAGEERMISFHNTLLHDENGPSGVLFSGEDITERKKSEALRLDLEAQLAQKHKMEALGMMAGGMAHNFNNNLAIILGGIDLTRIKLPGNSEVIPLLDNAKTAVLRSRDLIQNILSYSRQGMFNREPVQMALVVDETLKLLRSTIPTTTKIHYQPDAEYQDLTIQADSTRVQEALINLCNNAIQAMDERGELTISLKSIDLQPRDFPAQYQCSPGAYLQLSVQDSGCGMTADLVERIFDPFFTTKAVDQGTGMGLATLQGMIVQHGGMIKVQSTPGQGSTFELYFPLSVTAQPKPSTENISLPCGSEKILFLDDNEMLANLGNIMLSELGYQVCAMTSSTETLKRFQANPDHFDLVITDQTMPDMTGHELIQELRKIRPNLPAILCTGYSSKVDADIAEEFEINAFLMKPLELAKLAQTVRNVLDGVEIG